MPPADSRGNRVKPADSQSGYRVGDPRVSFSEGIDCCQAF